MLSLSRHCRAHSLTRSLTHSLTRRNAFTALTNRTTHYPLTHTLTHSLTRWPTTRSLCAGQGLPPHSPTHSLTHPTTPTTPSPTHSLTHSLEDRLYSITHGINGAKFRMFIRTHITTVAQCPATVSLAKSKYIEEKLWSVHAFNFRRKLAKAPECVYEGVALEQFLDLVEELLHLDGQRQGGGGVSECESKKMVLKKSEKSEEEFQSLLRSKMFELAETELREEIASSLTLLTCSDLRLPHEWYAPARLMKRKIIFHGGPTNSGKTYHALQRLMAASVEHGGGLYCGPLRLLALEVYDQLNKSGVYCNLITGQEQRRMPFSTHVSCTVEVVPVDVPYDVAIIDEIQMINDENRGFAWTRALLGVCAREIHVAGGMEAAPVVEAMAARTGDDFELRTYERLSKLVIQDESLKGDYSKVRPGDCIVAFSQFDIFSIKREIENLTDYKCCVVYGKLPPETRSKQARLFNEPDTGFDILVASDAIGMGLNLNIRRIIFHTAVKPGYGKKNMAPRYIEPGSIKQIAGRAGRLSSEYDYGEVTAWQEMDLAYIRSVMNYDVPPIKSAGIFPSIEQIDLFSRELIKHQQVHDSSVVEEQRDDASAKHDDHNPHLDHDDDSVEAIIAKVEKEKSEAAAAGQSLVEHTRLSLLMKKFVETSQTSGDYFLCEHSDLMRISNWLNSIPLTLTDRFVFGTAPVSARDHISVHMLYHYAAMYATNRPVPLKIRFPKRKPTDLVQFTEFCDKHNILDLYLWLANRFPKYFIEKENCLELKEFALKIIQSTLENSMLKHQYSHSQVFRSQRKRMHEEGVPSTELPHTLSVETRNDMLEFLQKTPEEEWHMFPNESYSGEETVTRSSRFGGGGQNSNGGKQGNRNGSSFKRGGKHVDRDDRNGGGKTSIEGDNRLKKQPKKVYSKNGAPRAVKVATADKERITKSADGRKIQKWNN